MPKFSVLSKDSFVDQDIVSIPAHRGPERTKDHSGQVYLLPQQTTSSDLLGLASQKGYRHLVQKSQNETTKQIRLARLMAQRSDVFLNNPVSSMLSPRSAGPETEKDLLLLDVSLNSYDDKAKILAQIEELFDTVKLRWMVRADVMLAADELMCNALFNAPRDGGVNSNGLNQAMNMAKSGSVRPANLRIGMDENQIAVVCIDEYGSLNPSRVFEKVKNCYDLGPGRSMNMDDAVGTAGIGSYLIFNACASYTIAVAKGSKTVVGATFDLARAKRPKTGPGKHLHWFVSEGA